MSEREQAFKIADMWLDGRMNSLTQMVPGDPDCDACVLARQYIRTIEVASDRLGELRAAYHALRSYQHGNSSTELAESVASRIQAAFAKRGENLP